MEKDDGYLILTKINKKFQSKVWTQSPTKLLLNTALQNNARENIFQGEHCHDNISAVGMRCIRQQVIMVTSSHSFLKRKRFAAEIT